MGELADLKSALVLSRGILRSMIFMTIHVGFIHISSSRLIWAGDGATPDDLSFGQVFPLTLVAVPSAKLPPSATGQFGLSSQNFW